jgi:hypothetical protein
MAVFDPEFPGDPDVGLPGWDEWEFEFLPSSPEFDCGGRGTCRMFERLSPDPF